MGAASPVDAVRWNASRDASSVKHTQPKSGNSRIGAAGRGTSFSACVFCSGARNCWAYFCSDEQWVQKLLLAGSTKFFFFFRCCEPPSHLLTETLTFSNTFPQKRVQCILYSLFFVKNLHRQGRVRATSRIVVSCALTPKSPNRGSASDSGVISIFVA